LNSPILAQLDSNESYDGPPGAYLFYYPFVFVMVYVTLNITVSLIMEVPSDEEHTGYTCA
jgi:hypothetical protein